MEKCLIVINPCSGLKTGMKNLSEILRIISNGGYLPTVFITKARGEATAFVRENASQYDLLVCIGGDGTFNEVVSGIIESEKKIPIGYIPAGSTNDFAKSLHLSTNLLQAAKDIVAADRLIMNFDVGNFDGRIFTYVASFGAFTKASYSTPQNTKNALGHLAYILEGIKDIPSIASEHLSFSIGDETIEGDYIFGAVSNSTSLGGLLKLNPDQVDMTDGQLELLLIKAPKNALDLVQIVHSLNMKKYNSEWITFRSIPSISVKASASMDWTLDGEKQNGKESFDIINFHHAIQLILPNGNAEEKGKTEEKDMISEIEATTQGDDSNEV